MTIPVILDVDTGVDDALALMLAVRHPRLDVRAVTCVGGNVGLDAVVDNTLRILELVGASGIPVAAGMREPLVEPAHDASYVHGADGLGGLPLPATTRRPEPVHAVELMRRTILAAARPVTIVALAPLTNVAVLLRMHPEVVPGIERIVFMGGAIGLGNATASAEFNVWHDPEAAEIVLRSGIPATMYGLEPFYEVTCSAETIAELAAAEDPVRRAAGFLLTHLAAITDDEERVHGSGAAAVGDAGTVCLLVDPDGARVRRAPVRVALSEGPTRGRTVVDLRRGLGADGDRVGAVDVVTGVDGPRYARLLLEALGART